MKKSMSVLISVWAVVAMKYDIPIERETVRIISPTIV